MFKTPPGEIKDIVTDTVIFDGKVIMTIVNGNIVYNS